MSETIVIAQCTDEKRDGKYPARHLYDVSKYFQNQAEYARTQDGWFIQSAKYGLLAPTDIVKTYDEHATNIDDREAWARDIAQDIFDCVSPNATIEILGGKDYADPLCPELEKFGFEVHEPLRGLRIGERMNKLHEMTRETANKSIFGDYHD